MYTYPFNFISLWFSTNSCSGPSLYSHTVFIMIPCVVTSFRLSTTRCDVLFTCARWFTRVAEKLIDNLEPFLYQFL
jgi:hypothetical protein